MVARHDGPAVFFRTVLDVTLARIDHRLDGENHAWFQLFQRAGLAVVQHLRVFMKLLTNAVAAKLAHDGKALPLGKLLNRKTNVTQPDTRLDAHDALPHGFKSNAAQAFGGNGTIADQKHAAGVAVPAVFDDRHVDVHDVAFFKWLVIRYAVAHLVVD